MDSCGDIRSKFRRNEFSAALCHLERAAQQSLRRGCAKADDHARLHGGDLRIEPWTTRGNVHGTRLLVNASFAARLPVEMLHSIGYVNVGSVDAGRDKSLVKDGSRGADEGPAAYIFFVARLLAHEHDVRVSCAFTENGLGSLLPKVTATALLRGFTQNRDDAALGEEFGCGDLKRLTHRDSDAGQGKHCCVTVGLNGP